MPRPAGVVPHNVLIVALVRMRKQGLGYRARSELVRCESPARFARLAARASSSLRRTAPQSVGGGFRLGSLVLLVVAGRGDGPRTLLRDVAVLSLRPAWTA
jgi:hypothetical protein